MKKFALALALGATGMVVFTACGAQEGTVYSTEYQPGHYKTVHVDDYIMVPYYDPNTKTTQIRQQWAGQHSEQRWVKPCYLVEFENDEGDKGHDCVSKGEFDSIDIGDFYSKE